MLILFLELLLLRIFELDLLRLKQIISLLKCHVLTLLSGVHFLHILLLVIFERLVDVELLVLGVKVFQVAEMVDVGKVLLEFVAVNLGEASESHLIALKLNIFVVFILVVKVQLSLATVPLKRIVLLVLFY